MKKIKTTIKLDIISNNRIKVEGSVKIGEGVKKLVNLTTLNLNFK
jgi:hypothetical protein